MSRNTKDHILLKAQELFIEKGYSAVRMHEIAESASVNKAMLHYYFKNKDNLYEAVFQNTFQGFIEQTVDIVNSEIPVKEKVPLFVSTSIDTLAKNPQIVIFIFGELNRNPERIARSFGGEGKIDFRHFATQVEEELGNDVDAEQFFADMVGLSISSIISKHILKTVLNKSDQQYGEFLEARKRHIISLLLK